MEDETQPKPGNDSPSLHETQTLDSSSDEAEEINESFLCCICLELLYKPVVLGCGHISCFWCVHTAMAPWRESHCPICRHEYNHFPSICKLLHILLLKMYPITYKSREKQLLEEEKERDIFSPELCFSKPKTPCPPTNSTSCSQSIPHQETNSSVKTNPTPVEKSQNIFVEFSHGGSANFPETSAENFVITKNVSTEENTYLNYEACKPISINDVLCITCKQMLFQPVILNCGHAYCESCLAVPENEALSCQLCQTSHPNGFPKVCLVLDNFLEAEFPQEYMQRREEIQHKLVHCQQGTASCATSAKKEVPDLSTKPSQYYSQSLNGIGPGVHTGAGCDDCGMYPIVGERYRCKDCVEAIGFDLCGSCYNTGSKRPGRFNQQHTEAHSFELVPARHLSDIITIRLLSVLADSASSGILEEAPDDDSALMDILEEAPADDSASMDVLDEDPDDSEISDSIL